MKWTEHRSSSVPGTVSSGPEPVAEAVPSTAGAPADHWRPSALTIGVGAGVLLIALIVGVTAGWGAFLSTIAVTGLLTGLYALITRRPTWLGLARHRSIGALTSGVAVVLLIVGGSVSPHSTGAGSSQIAGPASAAASATPTPAPTPTPTMAVVPAADYTGRSVTDAATALKRAGFVVQETVSTGNAPTDWSGWTVASETPAPGTRVPPGSTIVLIASAPATPTPTPSAGAQPSAPQQAQPAAPEQAAPQQAEPQPAQPAAPEPTAPDAPAPASHADVDPGGFCDDSDVGTTVTNSNGRSYTCGGKGKDKNGHYHWNSA